MRDKIINYVKAGYPGLYIVSHEEARVEAELRGVAQTVKFELWAWSCTQGVISATENGKVFPDTQEPMVMLDTFINSMEEKSILLCRDFHAFLTPEQRNPMVIRRLKDALLVAKNSNKVLIIVGCQLVLPPELEKEISVIEFKLPDKEQLRIVLNGIADSAGIALDGNGKTETVLDAATGMTTMEAESAFALSVSEAHEIRSDIVAREKSNAVKKNGILEIVDVKEDLDSMGGYQIAKDWTTKRKSAFGKKAKQFGLPTPKGVMLVGVPGCGKTYFARIISKVFNVPLLKLDAGKIFASHVGESEANLRNVIQTAEAVAPCVLLVDEVEKGLSGSKSSGSTDGGTSARVFGSFLQWMNDKTAPVFVVATANDISQLPPEFLRKGRFDELFFVDMPDQDERADIFGVHIKKNGRDPQAFDLVALAKATDSFTGAEIEAIVSESLYAAFDQDCDINNDILLDSVRSTVPLSRTMGDQINGLRTWAQGRARRASAVKQVEAKTTGRKLA